MNQCLHLQHLAPRSRREWAGNWDRTRRLKCLLLELRTVRADYRSGLVNGHQFYVVWFGLKPRACPVYLASYD